MSVRQVLIVDRYRLLRTVGEGGMGRVWLARDEILDREVAVKEVVTPQWLTEAEREELRARTMREARTAARLTHPNVVRIYDVVWADASPWIIMEYVPSRSVQEVLETEGPLSPFRAAQVGLHVLSALRSAHQAGVLHRDVKPHNVLLAEDGRVLLTDFGLATFDGGDGTMTLPGVVMGSPQYLAPERAAHGKSTVEADLWSLGATLHAAVEGRSPYARATSMATLSALASVPPAPAPHAGPLAPVLAGLLNRDPCNRVTAAEAERLLRRILAAPGACPPGRPAEVERVGWVEHPTLEPGPVETAPTSSADRAASDIRQGTSGAVRPSRQSGAVSRTDPGLRDSLGSERSGSTVEKASGQVSGQTATGGRAQRLWLAVAATLVLLMVVVLGAVLISRAVDNAATDPAGFAPPYSTCEIARQGAI